jgi:hypothetical protein
LPFFYNVDFTISSDDLQQLCLLDIDNFLCDNGKCLDDYKFMPKLIMSNNGRFSNVLIENEIKYDYNEMSDLFEEHIANLNSEQLRHIKRLSVLLIMVLDLCFLLMDMVALEKLIYRIQYHTSFDQRGK